LKINDLENSTRISQLEAHKFVSEIKEQEQRTKFVRVFNPLGAVLNGK
jgi:hypothetical protein